MPPSRKLARVDTMELKLQLVKKLGHQRAELYFHSLKKFLGGQLGKEEFDKISLAALGRENIKDHNFLIRSILGNVFMSAGPPLPSRQAATGNSQTSTVVSNGPFANDGILTGVKRGWMVANRDRRFDKPSPLGKSPLGHQGAGEFVSAGSKALLEVVSVEDGEEVDQARGSPVCAQSRSPIRAPLGVPKAQNFQPSMSRPSDTCYNNGELPETQSLLKLLENKLKTEGLGVPHECADVLNTALNAYISQLLKSCLGVAKARGNTMCICQANGSTVAAVNGGQGQGFCSDLAGYSHQASLQDLLTAVESNPRVLGCDYSRQHDKISSHVLDR
ncbi:hypothetical protein ABZP36_012816 [Zizania latifolia]